MKENKQCYVCETGDVEASHIAVIFDTKEKAKKWVQQSTKLKEEWKEFDDNWNREHNPDNKAIEETSWSTEEAEYYHNEFNKIDSDRESDYYSYREYEII